MSHKNTMQVADHRHQVVLQPGQDTNVKAFLQIRHMQYINRFRDNRKFFLGLGGQPLGQRTLMLPSLPGIPSLRAQHTLQCPRNLPPMTDALALSRIVTDSALVDEGFESVFAIATHGFPINGRDCMRDLDSAVLVADVAGGIGLLKIDVWGRCLFAQVVDEHG